jgi:hypothetical protein
MRHRKVINFYDTDVSHEDLLIYLESIEGSTRQSQALLQMVMIGFRVVTQHESGEEAYHAVRNPDFALALKKRLTPRTHVQRIGSKQVVEKEVAPLHDVPEQVSVVEEQHRAEPVLNPAIEAASTYIDLDETHVDEYNTLQILRAADRG